MAKVRTAIYTVAALILLLIFYRSRPAAESQAPAAKPIKPATVIEALKPMPETYDAAVDWHNILNTDPYSPVVIFSKSYCPHSKRAKRILLEEHTMDPKPLIVELDQHPNGQELQDYMHKQTARRTVPNVLVAKVTRGGGDDMAALQESGQLKKKFEEWAQGWLKVD